MLSQGSFDRQRFTAGAREVVAKVAGDRPFTALDAQVDLAEALATQRRVIAVLPTGSGKTLGAALPFALGQLIPGQMVYMTPLRTLTGAQAKTLGEQIDNGVATARLGLPWSVRQQTGVMPEDPDFEATASVTTFDQALSSALRISYSASIRRRTINAGAVLGSYLVADELHLFPRGEALTTLLYLLKHRPKELPFLLMTATLTPSVAERLACELDAHLLAAPLSPDDMDRLGLTMRRRHVRWQSTPLMADQIVSAVREHPQTRVLVVVNTVKRAIELGREVVRFAPFLKDKDRLRVLHARFYKADREEHERDVTSGFGRDREEAGTSFGADGGVVIATQVVEVGLDISADLLFTELAPASALVQRWGRCARWGGRGEIVVAPPPPRQGHEPGEGAVYPYTSRDDAEAIQGARDWLAANTAGPEGVIMDDFAEHALLDSSHGRGDVRWLDNLTSDLTQRATTIGETIAHGKYASAGQLIRDIDTRTVLICGYPDERLKEPYGLQGFALAPGSLMSLLPGSEKDDRSLFDDDDEGEGELSSFSLPGEGADWRLKRPEWTNDMREKESESSADTVSGWVEVTTAAEIRAQPLLLVHPRLIFYDSFFGLALETSAEPVPQELWVPPAINAGRHGAPKGTYSACQRETLEHHVGTMLALLERHPVLWPRLGRIAPLVDDWCGWPKGMLLQLIRAAIVAHDAGKLSPDWQRAIAAWQQAISMPMEPWLVHTDDAHGKPAPWNPPPHALSGAAHSDAIGEALDDLVAGAVPGHDWARPSSVLFTAVATHHAPSLAQEILSPAERLDRSGVAELNRLLHMFHVPGAVSVLLSVSLAGCGVAQANVEGEIGRCESFALALVTRLLRFADGWSQDPTRLAQAGIDRQWVSPRGQIGQDNVEGELR
jgi:CRISPR-associated endonuclease/helicase Cas3